MSTTFPPAPTYAMPIEVDQVTGRQTFSPLWLQWFLSVAQYFTSLGAGGAAVDHNALTGLQGGTGGQYYHLSSAGAAAVTGARILKGTKATDDLIVDLATKGLVLKDTQATPHYWRVTVSVLGVLTTTDLGTTAP